LPNSSGSPRLREPRAFLAPPVARLGQPCPWAGWLARRQKSAIGYERAGLQVEGEAGDRCPGRQVFDLLAQLATDRGSDYLVHCLDVVRAHRSSERWGHAEGEDLVEAGENAALGGAGCQATKEVLILPFRGVQRGLQRGRVRPTRESGSLR
jgi:hypothetical protein